jgi:uncharacterized membrane protein
MIFFFFRFALLAVQVQDGYGAPGFDLGIFDQGTWLLAHFRAPFVTVNGRDLFGDHTSFVMLLAVPLYWIWDQPQTLLVLQAFLLTAAAVPIYSLARRRLGTAAATAIALAYLLNPGLQRGDVEAAGGFHPESFLVFFLAVGLWAAAEWRPRLLAVAVVGCLLVKEDAAALVVPLGLWVAWRRDRRVGAAIVAGALAWTAFAYEVVIRFLLGDISFYANRIPFGGLGGLIGEPFTHPYGFWRYLIRGYRPFYVWQVGASFGWFFLIAPEMAAIGFLALFENVISNFPYMQQIQYHYVLPLVPVLAAGTVWALSRLHRPRARTAGAVYVLASAVIACWLWGLAPFSRNPVFPHSAPDSPAVLAANQALRAVPPDAVVSADYMYVTHLDHRVGCYEWPTPFAAQYWHLYTQEGQYLPQAATVEYLVVPATLSGSDAVTFDSIASQFKRVAEGGGVAVYRRVRPGPP